MKRWLLSAGLTGLLFGAAFADENSLRSLETGVEANPWEAVGRLDVNGKGFCTGALIAPDLVLTAAHCLYGKESGKRIDHTEIEFLAGWRNGRASAYRNVRRAVVHPEYEYGEKVSSARVRNDVALLELSMPIQNTTVQPFGTAERPVFGDRVGVVSYARDRSEAPSLQEVCEVLGVEQGVLLTSCTVGFGSSGAPIFTFKDGVPRIVSVVSAKAEIEGDNVSLGTDLQGPLQFLRAELAGDRGFFQKALPTSSGAGVGQKRRDTGAKFIRP